jgi:hypothetical protein
MEELDGKKRITKPTIALGSCYNSYMKKSNIVCEGQTKIATFASFGKTKTI